MADSALLLERRRFDAATTEVPDDACRMTWFLGTRPRWVVHPVVFAAAYVLNTALANDVVLAGWIRPLVVAMLVAALLTAMGWVGTRNRWDGALLASLIVLVAISPDSLAWLWVVMRGTLGSVPGTIAMAVLVWGVLGGIGLHVLRSRRRGRPVRRPSPEAMQVVSVAALLAVVGSGLLTHPEALLPRSVSPGVSVITHAPDGADQPDIVIILLDGYPRSDVLARRLEVDDSEFLEGLRARGFDVAAGSSSNYTHTLLTLASMFQMRYLDQAPEIAPLIGSEVPHVAELRRAAEAGSAFATLHAVGYEIILSAPGWEHAMVRGAADRMLDSGEMTDLERNLLHRTWLLYLADVVWPSVFIGPLRDRIVHAFDALDDFAHEPRHHPRFLFLHVPAPHLPLAVRAGGSATTLIASHYEANDRAGFGLTDAQFTAAWGEELAYLKRRVLDGIDALLASPSGRDAVVMVMADHGYGFEVHPDDPQARFANLFATRTPGAPSLFGDEPTPINLFRELFNAYLGTDMPILPARHFLSGEVPLQLTELDGTTWAAQP